MVYLNYFFNSIFDKPTFYLFSIVVTIFAQAIVSIIIVQIISKIFINSVRNRTIFSIIISIIVSFPGAYFLSSMMCFTATNDEQELVLIIFAIWFISLSILNFLLISFIRKKRYQEV